MACPLRTDRFSAVFYPGRSIVPPLLSTPGVVASCRKIESPGWRWKVPWRLSGNGPWRSWRGGRCVCATPTPTPPPTPPYCPVGSVCAPSLCGRSTIVGASCGTQQFVDKAMEGHTHTHTHTLTHTHTHTLTHTRALTPSHHWLARWRLKGAGFPNRVRPGCNHRMSCDAVH